MIDVGTDRISFADGLCSASQTSTFRIMSLTFSGCSLMVAGCCLSASSLITLKGSPGSFMVPVDQARVSVDRTKTKNFLISRK